MYQSIGIFLVTSLSEESPVELGPGGCRVGMGDRAGDISEMGVPLGPGGCECPCPWDTLIRGPAGW